MIDDEFSNPDTLYARYQIGRRQFLDTEELDAGVAQVAQGTVGAATGGGFFGGGGGGGGVGSCFTGEIRVPMFSGIDYDFSFLYENRDKFIGTLVKSFDRNNGIWPDEITHIHKSTIYRILEVGFKGEKHAMSMAKQHRFLTTRQRFESMSSLPKSTKVFNHEKKDWGCSVIERKKIITYAEGVDVYNLTTKKYHAYFAFAPGGKPKAVSNLKPAPD